MNVVVKFAQTIASTPNGIAITIASRVYGILNKSSFMNKSERPIAFRRFMLMDDIGVNILAKHNICNKTTHGNHLSVSIITTRGSANNANKVSKGNVTNAV